MTSRVVRPRARHRSVSTAATVGSGSREAVTTALAPGRISTNGKTDAAAERMLAARCETSGVRTFSGTSSLNATMPPLASRERHSEKNSRRVEAIRLARRRLRHRHDDQVVLARPAEEGAGIVDHAPSSRTVADGRRRPRTPRPSRRHRAAPAGAAEVHGRAVRRCRRAAGSGAVPGAGARRCEPVPRGSPSRSRTPAHRRQTAPSGSRRTSR